MKKTIDWIIKDIHNFCKKFNFSKGELKNDYYTLSGKIEIKDPAEHFIWDTFDVEYKLCLKFYLTKDYANDFEKSYPKYLPQVILKDHNSIKTPDRHISNNGKCCLATDVEAQEIIGQNYSLEIFTNQLVIPFFASQVYFDNTGKWPYGDYKHYEEGLIQYYQEKINVSKTNIIKGLEVLSGKRNIDRNDICFCGSGLKYKKCHSDIIEPLKLHVNNLYFRQNLQTLKQYYEEQNIKD